MTDAVQQPLVAFINNIPAIVAALAAAWVVVWRSNKKTEKEATQTNKLVAASAAETTQKLDTVHETVNGNLSAERARADAAEAKLALALQENRELKRKRRPRPAKRSPPRP